MQKNLRIYIYAENKNLGSYGGLNYLMDKANGDYIAIQDHDDVRHETKLEEQIKFLDKNEQYIGCGCQYLDYWSKQKKGSIKPQLKGNNVLEQDLVPHPSLVFRNTGVRYKDMEYFGDCYFEKFILSKEGKLCMLPKPLLLHYEKENGGNYGQFWFKINKESIKTYFLFNKKNFKSICILIYMCIKTILPKKIQVLLSTHLNKIYDINYDIELLITQNNKIKDMMKYIQKYNG